jgi:hypothetical protein
MKWVAQFAHMGDDAGSKMDISNLATVLAPNILYSKGKDPIKDESFCAIESVTMLLEHAEEFSTVPEDFVPLLQSLVYGEGDMELNVRHILRKCEVAMKLKRTRSAGGPIPPQLPRQHSSPAAVAGDYQQHQLEQQLQFYLSSSPTEASNLRVQDSPITRSQSSSQLNDHLLLQDYS